MIKSSIRGKKSDIDSLSSLLEKKQGGRVVLTGGIFDFMKPYHIDLFDFVSSKGDIVIVAVERTGKYTPLEERFEILEAVEKIDYLVSYSFTDDLNKIGQILDVVVINDEFSFPSDLISFSGEVLKFPI